MHSNGVT